MTKTRYPETYVDMEHDIFPPMPRVKPFVSKEQQEINRLRARIEKLEKKYRTIKDDNIELKKSLKTQKKPNIWKRMTDTLKGHKKAREEQRQKIKETNKKYKELKQGEEYSCDALL